MSKILTTTNKIKYGFQPQHLLKARSYIKLKIFRAITNKTLYSLGKSNMFLKYIFTIGRPVTKVIKPTPYYFTYVTMWFKISISSIVKSQGVNL